MSDRYHINPETGRSNKCYAEHKCRFGLPLDKHYNSAAEARAGFEENMKAEMLPTVVKPVSSEEKKAKAAKIAADDAVHEAAKAHDEKIYELYIEQNKIEMRAMGALKRLARTANVRFDRYVNPAEVLEKAAERAATITNRWNREHAEDEIESYKTNIQKAKDLQSEIREMDQAYTGWSRFFIVPGGHIHSSRNCHTCNKNWESPTQFGWLPGLSGKSEDKAVAEHGALLCTVCFPDAPVEWTNHYEAEAEAKKKAQCPGSGTWDYPNETARKGFYSGNYGVCKHCNERVTITSTGKMRAHKPDGAK